MVSFHSLSMDNRASHLHLQPIQSEISISKTVVEQSSNFCWGVINKPVASLLGWNRPSCEMCFFTWAKRRSCQYGNSAEFCHLLIFFTHTPRSGAHFITWIHQHQTILNYLSLVSPGIFNHCLSAIFNSHTGSAYRHCVCLNQFTHLVLLGWERAALKM